MEKQKIAPVCSLALDLDSFKQSRHDRLWDRPSSRVSPSTSSTEKTDPMDWENAAIQKMYPLKYRERKKIVAM